MAGSGGQDRNVQVLLDVSQNAVMHRMQFQFQFQTGTTPKMQRQIMIE